MTRAPLVVLLGGRVVGRVERDRRGRLEFAYAPEWRSFDGAHPLSLSLPLAAAVHPHARIDAYMRNLLPDNERVLERWGRRFQVSAHDAFGLLSHVGEDCAGAVQFVRAERVAAASAARRTEVAWLTPREVGERLARLRADHAAWRDPVDAGQFSLAGAQPKTALYFDGRRWGVPAGRTPTTHILKPVHGEFDGHLENEHLCLALARELGIPAAGSQVRRFGGERAIVIERYDRARASDLGGGSAGARSLRIVRLHQEDLCQALGLPPTAKYQNEGGPGVREVAELLRSYSSRPEEDVGTLLDAIGFAWLTAGTDAHAKNFSVLHGAGGRVRLAPLYDVASALPYGFELRRLRLAMKVGGEYRVWNVGARHWRALAAEVRVDPDRMVARLVELAERLPDAVAAVRKSAVASGLNHPLVARLSERLEARAAECRRELRR